MDADAIEQGFSGSDILQRYGPQIYLFRQVTCSYNVNADIRHIQAVTERRGDITSVNIGRDLVLLNVAWCSFQIECGNIVEGNNTGCWKILLKRLAEGTIIA